MADCEAWIDFSDEGQVDEDLLSTIDVKIKNIKDELHRELKSKSFEIVRSGLTVAIIGPPNAGKSSLLNFLVKRPASIVSPIKGTTRDVVQVTLDLQGIPVLLHDTAGIRKNSEDIVESEGISRAIKTARSANIILLLIPADELHLLDDWIHEFKLDFEKTFVFVTKTDLVSDESFTIPAELKICSFLKCGNNDYSPVENFLYNFVGNIDICMEQPAIVQERHRQLVTQSLRHLEEAQSHLNSEKIVISAAHLRRAANCIGQVTGHIDVEQVLDLIFSKFCIGK